MQTKITTYNRQHNKSTLQPPPARFNISYCTTLPGSDRHLKWQNINCTEQRKKKYWEMAMNIV